MYELRTTKQLKYFDEVIRLYYEEGYSESRIASVLPIGLTTVWRWISIFVSQGGDVPHRVERCDDMKKSEKTRIASDEPQCASQDECRDCAAELRELKLANARLQMELRRERMRADLLDEMINVGEAMFKVPIRKKAGAKQ